MEDASPALERITAVFRRADRGGQGLIRPEQLAALVRQLLPATSEEIVQRLVGAEWGQAVEYERWLQWVSQGATAPSCGSRAQPTATTSAANAHVVQVTDVHTLEESPSLNTLTVEKRSELEESRGGASSGSKTGGLASSAAPTSCTTPPALQPGASGAPGLAEVQAGPYAQHIVQRLRDALQRTRNHPMALFYRLRGAQGISGGRLSRANIAGLVCKFHPGSTEAAIDCFCRLLQADTDLSVGFREFVTAFNGAPDWYEEASNAGSGSWSAVSTEGLRCSLLSGAVGLLRGSYLLRLLEREERLPRRQDIPNEAFWPGEEAVIRIKGSTGLSPFLLAVSYRWLEPVHPDASCHHMKILGHAIRLMMSKVGDIALFWDFGSIHQKDRTPAEKALFLEGLKAANLIYGHPLCCVLLQTVLPSDFRGAYTDSGWCFFEASVSSISKDSYMLLDLARQQGDESTWGELRGKCAGTRGPPMTPESFAAGVQQREFTNGSDREMVTQLYRATFTSIAGSSLVLDFTGLGWTSEMATVLSTALPHYQRCRELTLDLNPIGDAGVQEIAKQLPKMPALVQLSLNVCNFTEESTVLALSEGLAASPLVTRLYMQFNAPPEYAAQYLGPLIEGARKGILIA